jgi:hypothetical protein
MKNITAKQLSFLLGIPKEDAIKKINYVRDKHKVRVPSDDNEKNPAIDIKLMSDNLGTDLNFYIKDISENYMTRHVTRGFILNYPATKLKPNKEGKMPRSVTIPTVLRSFLKDEVSQEIVEAWKEKYSWWIKEHEIKFK